MATTSIASIREASLLLLLLLTDVIAAVITCPTPCTCAGSHVTCHSQLSRVPAGLPAHITWLDLSHNNISHLDGRTLSSFVNLTRLNFYGNNIHNVAVGTFQNLTNLQSLNLGYNHLSYLKPDDFKALKNLRSVYLSGNPWHCDCHLEHLITWVHASSAVQVGRWGPTCASPWRLRNKPLSQVDLQTLCTGTTPVHGNNPTRTTTELTTAKESAEVTYKIPSLVPKPTTTLTTADCTVSDLLRNITISDSTVQWRTSSSDVARVTVSYQVRGTDLRRTRVLYREQNSFSLDGLMENTTYTICVRAAYQTEGATQETAHAYRPHEPCPLTNHTCLNVTTTSTSETLHGRAVPQHSRGEQAMVGVLAAVVVVMVIVATVIIIATFLRQKISTLVHRTPRSQEDSLQMMILSKS